MSNATNRKSAVRLILAISLLVAFLVLLLNWRPGKGTLVQGTPGVLQVSGGVGQAAQRQSSAQLEPAQAPGARRQENNSGSITGASNVPKAVYRHRDEGEANDANLALVFDRGQVEHVPSPYPKSSTQGSNAARPTRQDLHPTKRPSTAIRSASSQTAKPNCTYCLLYDLQVPLNEEYDCVPLQTEPSPPICLHPKEDDIFVSQLIRETGIWERHIVEKFQESLQKDLDLGVIDLGANIGQYSLVAAKMGRSVLAVEPHTDNIKRLQKACQLAQLCGYIRLLQNALSDNRGDTFMVLTSDNQGDVRLSDARTSDVATVNVQVIHLDDLLSYVTFDRAVLKIDIQGQEHRAFAHAEKLLDSVAIHTIFMEWVLMLDYYGSQYDESEDRILVEKMIQLLTRRGYEPYSLGGGALLLESWFQWPSDVMWVRETVPLGSFGTFGDKHSVR